jgi:hypothetical protein
MSAVEGMAGQPVCDSDRGDAADHGRDLQSPGVVGQLSAYRHRHRRQRVDSGSVAPRLEIRQSEA